MTNSDSHNLGLSKAESVNAAQLFSYILRSSVPRYSLPTPWVGYLLEACHSASENVDHAPGTVYEIACWLDSTVASIDQMANSNNWKRWFG